MKKIRRILVIKPSSMGDIIHVFPALELLHRAFPKAELDFVIHPAFAELLKYSPFPVSRKIMFERRKLARLRSFLPELLKLVRKLRFYRYDLIIDFQGLLRSGFIAGVAKGGETVGFANPREGSARFFYRTRIPAIGRHAVEKNFNLVRSLLHSQENLTATPMPANDKALSKLEMRFGKLPEKYIVLAPGARWSSKIFPPELFSEIISLVHAEAPEYVFFTIGGSGDREREETLAGDLAPDVKLVRTSGRTSLSDMIELIRHSKLLISNDTGPVHSAAALGREIFAFYGPTDPAKTGPYSTNAHIYQYGGHCLKCLSRRCRVKKNSLSAAPCHDLDAAKIAADIIAFIKGGDKPCGENQ
ncbi:MAG: glycosyltransferase family 9 protein [Victivallaceae bacterium]|nr:glycosyltransferase family 9 protein [Victivallaceae bacterium]